MEILPVLGVWGRKGTAASGREVWCSGCHSGGLARGGLGASLYNSGSQYENLEVYAGQTSLVNLRFQCPEFSRQAGPRLPAM